MKKEKILAALRAKEEDYIIEDTGILLKLKGFTFDQLSEYSELIDNGKTKEALNYVIYNVFRESLPTLETNSEDGFSDDEIRGMVKTLPAKIATNILNKMQEVSGLNAEKKDVENQDAKKELSKA